MLGESYINEQLTRFIKWGRVSSYIMMGAGGLQAIAGAFAFLIGAAPGVLTFFLGLHMFRAVQGAERMKMREPGGAEEMYENLADFARLQAITFIAVFGILFLIILIIIFGLFSIINAFGS